MLCTKFYQNQPKFVEDMTKTYWLTFFWTPCIYGADTANYDLHQPLLLFCRERIFIRMCRPVIYTQTTTRKQS